MKLAAMFLPASTKTLPQQARWAANPFAVRRGAGGLDARPSPRLPSSGFSMTELLITIIIVGILAAIAVPSYTAFVATQRIKTASFDLVSTLTLARSEAIKRNVNVTVTRTGSSWESGWSVTTTTPPPVSTITLSVHDPVTGTTIAGPANVTYAANGRLTGTASTLHFEISSITRPSATARCISIDPSGRPSSKGGGC